MTGARSALESQLALAGMRVLIPRGGDLGDRLAAAVSVRGGEAVIAPIIEFREPADRQALSEACERLSGGSYDWVAVTSATTADVLVQQGVLIPKRTRVAVVGPATRDALAAAGFPVDFMPTAAHSATAMVEEWPGSAGSVLLPQSAIAEQTLADGLAARGLTVTSVAAYEATTLRWSEQLRQQVSAGEFAAVLLTSASVARAVADQGGLPSTTTVACIGESTAAGARAAGLHVHVIAEPSTAEALVAAVAADLNHEPSAPRTKVCP